MMKSLRFQKEIINKLPRPVSFQLDLNPPPPSLVVVGAYFRGEKKKREFLMLFTCVQSGLLDPWFCGLGWALKVEGSIVFSCAPLRRLSTRAAGKGEYFVFETGKRNIKIAQQIVEMEVERRLKG